MVGWQIDNEFTLSPSPRCYCDFCQAGFQEWVRSKYGSLEKLNQTWGTVFWSQTYTDFNQIPVPLPSGGDPESRACARLQPLPVLRQRIFPAKSNWSCSGRNVRKHFVTTNNVGPPVDYIDMHELYKNLDFVAFDNYPGFFEMLMHEQMKSARCRPAPSAPPSRWCMISRDA